jgi:sigma-B regulation protein RsbU (phosphoserine phosphatase)
MKIFLCVLNLHSGVLLSFNAGPVDPIIKSKNGNIKFIKGPFIPTLGSELDSSFTKLVLQLDAGDQLCFYTKSTIENQNKDGEQYGNIRLLNLISSSSNNSNELIESIYKDINNFTNNSSETEVAIAILNYTP